MPCLIDNIRCDDEKLQHLIIAIDSATSLKAVVLVGWQLALRLAILLIEEILHKRAQQPTQWSDCPMCGRKLQSKGFVPRQLTTIIGVIRFSRRVGRCPVRCRIGQIAPLDTALQLTPHQRSGVMLKRLSCLLVVFVPFETAANLLGEVIGIKVSANGIWHWVQHAGQKAIDTLNEQLSALAQGTKVAVESMEPATAELPMLVGADGVMVPFRRETGSPKGATIWREVKVAIITRLAKRRKKRGSPSHKTQTRLVNRKLVACLGSIDDLGQRLWLQAQRQGVLAAKQVVWISDGARGFWRLFQTYFSPFAIGILDFYHAAANVYKAAQVYLDGRTNKARVWFELTRHRLRHGPTMGVVMSIEKALADSTLCKTARKSLCNLLNYLDVHHNHIQYHHYKAMGLPIGSGMVESACKWLILQRFKQVGQRWSEEGFNTLLQLRLAWINGRFDQLFTTDSSPN